MATKRVLNKRNETTTKGCNMTSGNQARRQKNRGETTTGRKVLDSPIISGKIKRIILFGGVSSVSTQ
eukprot:scaffold23231_cov145-Amphora_coffeaeformis.AAC.2